MNQLGKIIQAEVLRIEEESRGKEIPCRPLFHIMPPAGWLNDPNGLCWFQGKYHVFFQYSPFDVNGGLKIWGHMTGEDLINWEYQGAPLLADTPYDCHGVYSGSAWTEDGIMHLFYTGNVKFEDKEYDYINNGRGSCVLHVSSRDGIHFSEKKVVLTNQDYPEDYTCHVRDPKVWKEDGKYRMILGGRRKDGKGAVLFYQSEDLEHWELEKELTTEKPFGYMWECPDLFSVNGQKILSVSPQGLEPQEYCYQNVYQSGYFLVEKEDGRELQQFREWDYGFDFYAPQTFEDNRGRRILIGWMGMPDSTEEYQNPTVAQGWQHVLTLPREITVREKKVYQYPVEELKEQRKDRAEIKGGEVYSFEGNYFEVEAEAARGDLKICLDEDLHLEYEENTRQIRLIFTGAGGCGRTIRKTRLEEFHSVRLTADASCVEIYLNQGEMVFSTRYYPQTEKRSLKLEGIWKSADFYKLSR